MVRRVLEFNIYAFLVVILALACITVVLNKKLIYFIDRKEPEVYGAILNTEELEKHALDIAKKHITGKKSRVYYSLEGRMNKNFKLITSVYKSSNENMNRAKRVAPAVEWLLDNFYIIEEQVKEIRQNLSRQYYYRLPSLKSGILKGYPRVYAIALELVSHTDGRFDDKLLISFVSAYQKHSILSSGELWAIPMMVRMALIEHIRHICEEIMESQQQWDKAEKLADILLSQKGRKPEELLAITKEYNKQLDRITPSFGEHLLNRLMKHGLEIAPIIKYFDEKLSEQHTTSESITKLEHKEQAARQVSIGNAITSLRLLSTLDWKEIFEELSQIEQILRRDPGGIYGSMDFSSRDFYRHEVEKISKKYKISEIKVARKLIECAEEMEKHLGYFLFRDESSILISKLGYEKKNSFSKSFIYIASIILITAAIDIVLLYYLYNSGIESMYLLILLAVALLVPSSDIAVNMVNLSVVHIKSPAFLPKLELKDGIPDYARTVIVMPVLLTDEQRTETLLGYLEEYYLANRERNLYFVLLGDFKDSKEEKLESDVIIIEAARKKIRELNKKYRTDEDIFFFFHRKRIFNKSQKRWMGWERKRGALFEFNEFLLSSKLGTFSFTEGNISNLKNIAYIITIDADTKLTIETAKKLIGTIIHPLNKAVVDTHKGIVKQGYGLLQPRITVDIESAGASPFSRIFAGQGGIDIYTNAVSDVYQDLFGEGIFTGKGIYEVKVFQSILREAIPENTVLSHDLLEGSYVRTGLVTDIELIDGYPVKYDSYSMRLHRWVRGDWQLIHWLFRKVKSKSGKLVKNPLSSITKWKITDNLRRSLVSPSQAVLFLLSFSILKGNSLIWLLISLLPSFLPVVTNIINTIINSLKNEADVKTAYYSTGKVKLTLQQCLATLVFMPHQAYLMLDAIIRTIYRVFISREKMLEWVTAADVELSFKSKRVSYWTRMWICPVYGAVIISLAVFYKSELLIPASVLALLWITAPYTANILSTIDNKKEYDLNSEELEEFRILARKTWSYFEDFVSVLDNYLPPDNYQENPPNGIAHRTSPTNIGLYLASIMAARDLGYISTTNMLDRLNKSISTIEKMKKWKGHLYNWYDTISLEVLKPNYISTVDSGNFIGYLMVLKQGLLEYMKKPLLGSDLVLGLKDTVVLLNEEKVQPVIDLHIFDSILNDKTINPIEWHNLLIKLDESNNQKLPKWGFRLYKSINSFIGEIYSTMPWLKTLSDMPQVLESEVEQVINQLNANYSFEQYWKF